MACLALAGCATPRQADVRLPAAYEGPASVAPPGAIALDRWWTAYGDEQLNTLVDQALARNPDVRTASARLDEVKAQRTGAILQYLPQGDAQGSARKTHTEQLSGTTANIPGFSTSGTSKNYSANFNVSWESIRGGGPSSPTRPPTPKSTGRASPTKLARASIAAETADAYFQARGLSIQLADALQTVRIRQQIYDLADKRGKAGIAATSEADRVAADLAQAQSQVAGLEAQLQVQKRAILILAGRIVEPTANISAPPEVGARRPCRRRSQRALGAAPGRAPGAGAVRSAAGQQTLAQLAFFPTFTFSPGIGWSKIEQPGFSSETENWILGGSVLQPILSIPRLMSELKAQNARTEQAVTAYEKTVQTAFQESEAALVSLDADRRQVTILADGEVRAQRAFKAQALGYQHGVTNLDDLLTAEQNWRVIRVQLAAAQVQALRRSVQAYKALGGGWPAQAYAQVK
jgi:NodT family efflux transporter outer membrane factor (OMF) lipoprotein